MEGKLTAILCADVRGYSRLMRQAEEPTLRSLSASRKIIDGLIDHHRGRFVGSAGIETPLGCHTFRATGITDYLTNGGRIEVAQKMAGHSNGKMIGLHDRRNDDIGVVRLRGWGFEANTSE
jgi:integrase